MNKLTTPGAFAVGDQVLLSMQNLKLRSSKKFKLCCAGPFEVVKCFFGQLSDVLTIIVA